MGGRELVNGESKGAKIGKSKCGWCGNGVRRANGGFLGWLESVYGSGGVT
jgi:hypothetical protein